MKGNMTETKRQMLREKHDALAEQLDNRLKVLEILVGQVSDQRDRLLALKNRKRILDCRISEENRMLQYNESQVRELSDELSEIALKLTRAGEALMPEEDCR